ncbi:22043_t:CDS:1, partial [Cetraspora pellucida]
EALYVLQIAMHLKGYNQEVQAKCLEKQMQFTREFQAKYTT